MKYIIATIFTLVASVVSAQTLPTCPPGTVLQSCPAQCVATPSPSPTPIPTASPTPTGLPQTITISSPQNGSTVLGGQPWIDNNSTSMCSGASWYDACYVDGVHIGDAGFSHCQTPTLSPGTHTIAVHAHTSNAQPNPRECAISNTVSVLVGGDSTPIPTSSPTVSPSSTPTPVGRFTTLGYKATLPSESTCTAIVNASPTAERIPGNNAFNIPPSGIPASFYINPTPTKGDSDSVADFQGVSGNFTGSTDDIIRWAACKYGVDEDVIRAQGITESHWDQGEPGDKRTTKSQCVQPGFTALWNTTITEPDGSVVSCPNCCWQSWSLWQTKVWDNDTTWPMMMQSTPFAADYRYADQRSCMNGNYAQYMASQGGNTYAADIAAFKAGGSNSRVLWGCIGTHYSGNWYDSGAQAYITETQNNLAAKAWMGLH